jgi:hypothetical protein
MDRHNQTVKPFSWKFTASDLRDLMDWGAPKLPDSPSIRMDVWKGEVIASTEEELLSRIQR